MKNWLLTVVKAILRMERDPQYPHIYYLLNSAWACQCVYLVAKMDIAEKLRDGPRSAKSLAEECGVDASGLCRILRLLAAFSIFEQQHGDSFLLGRAGMPLLRDHRYTVHHYAIIWGEQLQPAASKLMEQLQSGSSGFELHCGSQAWDYYESSDHASQVFYAFMNSVTDCHLPFIVAAHKWSRYSTMVDVGGGGGSFLSAVLKATPGLHGTWFDRSDAKPFAERAASNAGVSERCIVVPGDFEHDDLPKGADLYTIKHVLHDWDNLPAQAIIKRIAEAMREDSKLIIIEALVDSRNRCGGFCKLRDIEQMFWNNGRERTREEFEEMLKPAGLVITRTTPTPIVDVSLIEASFR